MKPILIVGAGPVGLTTALALQFYGLPFLLFEEDDSLSSDTKAGTILTRTLEAFRRYGVADDVLAKALRVDEIGDIERATGAARPSVRPPLLDRETQYPFVVNLPQHHLEPILHHAIETRSPGSVRLQHRLTSFSNHDDGVTATFETPNGAQTVEGSYLLACDGGRSTIRSQLDIKVEGESLSARNLLVDVKVDLDVANPRDYPYLAYFADPDEWMVLVRQPHCWRFLFPLAAEAPEPSADELRAKVLKFIGPVTDMEILNTILYRIHHRIASNWRSGRVFLMGDAAHLITPMWALGLNTGILDAISLPWRLAWVARGWAIDALLDGYSREQHPVAALGSGEMAEAGRKYMLGLQGETRAMSGDAWGNALTRTMLGVRLDVDQIGDWSMVKTSEQPLQVGDRMPDVELHGPDGRPVRLHQLIDDTFLALYFTDPRRKPQLPADQPGLKHMIVSRWDAPLDSGVRHRSLFDVGDRLRSRAGCAEGTVLLIRPDDHIAAMMPIADKAIVRVHRRIVEPNCQD
ncbi:FAD-binding monooxygenase [Tardiphaga sp. vice154]|uniref:FAD-dependent monooxygenase n=1 Tax=Tardiphaga sp. vice154 TaxID=2592814 RepID=UPI001161D7C2|nr:FAD-dependent monooxygenase [Tardiphaga sp. vice154]QDM20765.1 FAD-binding monooxygenase [Tardiphaga sp. vice154]